jgi:hypothetical protein
MTKTIDHNAKTSPAAVPGKVGADAAVGSSKGPHANAAAGSPPLPKSWSEIRIGSLVIAQENVAEGWWEATVTEVREDVLTLRWHGYPRLPAFVRNRKQVGLLFPGN